MTTREFYNSVISFVDGTADVDETILKAKAVELIASLDAKNAKRTSADSKEKQATSARRNSVLAVLSANVGRWFTRDDIALEIGDITPSQVTSACSALVKAETVSKMEMKFGKTRKTVYAVLPIEDKDSEDSNEESSEESSED